MGHQLVHQIGGRPDTGEFATATFVANSGEVKKLSNRDGLSVVQGGDGDPDRDLGMSER